MRNKRLEEVLNGWPWAYTGSIAMKLHANRLGVNFPKNRRIGNINIAARPNVVLHLVAPIKKAGYNLANAPNKKHLKFNRRNNGMRLNVFPANGRLAPNFSKVQKFNRLPPVMSVNALLNQKRKINRNDVFGNNIRKLEENIKLLKKLQR